MKNLLKKLSLSGGTDRRAELEAEAAERIKAVGSERPAEAITASHPAPAPVEHRPEQPVASRPSGRRMTVQERVAARQLQGQNH